MNVKGKQEINELTVNAEYNLRITNTDTGHFSISTHSSKIVRFGADVKNYELPYNNFKSHCMSFYVTVMGHMRSGTLPAF